MIGKKEIILGLCVHFFLLVSMSIGIVVAVQAQDKALSETNQQKNNSSSDITANVNNTLSNNSTENKNVPASPASSENSGILSVLSTAPEKDATIIAKVIFYFSCFLFTHIKTLAGRNSLY